MLRHPEYTRARIGELVNTVRGLLYPEKRPIENLRVLGPTDRIGYAAAMRLKDFEPATLGRPLGPDWATYWFRGTIKIPRAWAGRWVELLWDTNSEGALWIDGKIVQGLNTHAHGPRLDAVIARRATGGETVRFVVETACNQKFGVSSSGGVYTRKENSYALRQCEIARRDDAIWPLLHDLTVLVDLEKEHAALDPAWAGRLLSTLNAFANAFDPDDRATWAGAHKLLKPLLASRNGTTTHETSAIGHAHIDTAWLWPLAETWRKCERSFASACAYMDDYPAYKFACSQAYQYDVVRRRNPDLYARIKERAKRGQWIPVGGTWVEPDCNIPSGESLCRQFLFGQRFFEREFGRRCNEFWNPDVFGYNGQLPQIMALAGIRRFLTQKLSWNRFTKPMHHTFDWEGIDGTRVLAHFPPADTYNADASVKQVRFAAANYKDHDRSRHSLYLFGYGDGGGGPTRDMLERLARFQDLQGVPRTTIRSSDAFFDLLDRDNTDRATIVGELYFELHRGTYTSQAAVKRGNRTSEFRLHDAEYLATAAALYAGRPYPRDAINALWETVLLNQFHDILPGSSIGEVYTDAATDHSKVLVAAAELVDGALASLTDGSAAAADVSTPVNTCPFDRVDVVETGDVLRVASAPAYGSGRWIEPTDTVRLTRRGGSIVLENDTLRATLDAGGRLTGLIHKPTGREALSGPANVFELYDDRPTKWEAWDVDPFHLETGKPCPPARSMRIVTDDTLRAEVQFVYALSDRSSLVQSVRLDAHAARLEFDTHGNWNESRKMLKVAFPVAVRSDEATYEMQFGSVRRPTHFNAPADVARYEVPLHKWFDLGEGGPADGGGFGVSVLSADKYGGSVRGDVMRLSLLRSPKSPDPDADMGRHAFSYAVYPHAGDWRTAGTVAEAFRFNQPTRVVRGAADVRPVATVDHPAVVLDTVKFAEDADAVVLRLYESHGSRGTARVRLGAAARRAEIVNILEDRVRPLRIEENTISVAFRPWEIVAVRVFPRK